MANKVIGYCPVCKEKLYVKTLRCSHCDIEVSGEFEMTPFDYLSPEQLSFALLFIKEQGNIKSIEKALGISYPTVKKNLEELCKALSLKYESKEMTRDDVKVALKNGEISFEEAERILGDL